MSDATAAGWTNQLIELTKILLSVLVGFISGVFLKKYDSRRNIRNMKMILFKELSINYGNLNKVLPKDGKFHLAFYDLPLQVCCSLQHAVYDSYLGLLAELHKLELEKIFDAYHWLLELRKEATALNMSSTASQKESQEVIQLRINIFLQSAEVARQKMEGALSVFKDGNNFLKDAIQHRGVEYEKVFVNVSRAVKNKDRS